MEHRTKRNHPRFELIADYELKNENGSLGYLEEIDFHQLINYYEDEFLIDQAIEVADHAIGQHPFCVEFLMIKARLLLSDDKPYRAMRYLDQAEVMSPFELDVYLLRARVFSVVGEVAQAKDLLEEAMKFSPGSEDRVEIYLSEATIYENTKDFDRMFEALSNAEISF
jgi:tetratricopeptide (TPR) repeat protein